MDKIKRVIKYFLPYKIDRFLTSFTFNKERFKLKQSKAVFNEIYEKNFWNSDESNSGEGSTLDATLSIRKALPEIIKKYEIKSMLDIPCGDYNWMQSVELGCDYIGADVVENVIKKNTEKHKKERVQFDVIDLRSGKLPKVDLIFSKDCLQHLSHESVMMALKNIVSSQSKYLLITNYPGTWRNYDIYDGDYRALNLCIHPFNLPKPIFAIHEKVNLKGVEPDKSMYFYKISDLGSFLS